MKDANILRKEVLYQVFVRQYGSNHNFDDVAKDLKRIKSLGASIIYLMPIFPIGKINRKGTYGSPYAIADYDTIDPFLGGKEGLVNLINECHKLGLKIIVDLALNHTSPDAKLLSQNESFYYHRDGKISGKCADWSDVVDLDYDNKELYPVIINSVCNLLRLGLDGFRMDVCSLIPMKFWRELYKELIKINPEVLMVGESVHPGFRDYILSLGVDAPSDEALYEVFDVLYEYDIDEEAVKMKKSNLKELDLFIKAVEKENNHFNKPKLRYLENHDTERIASFITDKLDVLHALNFFLPGLTFVYAGEEFGIAKRPDLFELDPIDFKNIKADYSNLFKKLADIRKMNYFYNNQFEIVSIINNVYVLRYKLDNKSLYGIFNFNNEKATINLNINNGKYLNLLNNEYINVRNNNIEVLDMLIFEA